MNEMGTPQARLVQPFPAGRNVYFKLKTSGTGLTFQTWYL